MRFPIDGTGRLASEREHPTGVLPLSAVSDSSPHGATAGQGIVYNGSAWVGDERPVDVRNTQTNPSGVTDWGPIINGLIADDRHLFFGGDFHFTTPLAPTGHSSVTFSGVGGTSLVNRAQTPSKLLYDGAAGTGIAIDARGCNGFLMHDLGVAYMDDTGGWTGTLVDMGGDAGATLGGSPRIERCFLGSYVQGITQCFNLVGLIGAVHGKVKGCLIDGAQWGVLSGNFLGSTDNSSSCTVADCWVTRVDRGCVANPCDGWLVDNVRFDLAATVGSHPCGVGIESGRSIDVPGGQFVISNCYAGDVEPGSTIIAQGGAQWFLYATGNTFLSNALVFNLQGSGSCTIVGNPNLDSQRTGIIDLGSVAKESVTIIGNNWDNLGSEAILNRGGHTNVNIWGNGHDANALEQRSVGGHERITFANRENGAALTPLAALGSGATTTGRAFDSAGRIILSPGSGPSAGALCKVTFATPMASEFNPGTPQLNILLSSLVNSNGAAAGLYVTEVDNSTAFEISALNAPTGDIYVNYRVLML